MRCWNLAGYPPTLRVEPVAVLRQTSMDPLTSSFFAYRGLHAGRLHRGAPVPTDAFAGELVLVQEIVHRGPADAKLQSSSTDVPSRTSQCLDDDLSLDAIPCLAERQALGPCRGCDAEIRRLHEAAARQDHGPLDGILELTDVSRPLMVEDGVQRMRAEL